jgi:hypothetical protein
MRRFFRSILTLPRRGNMTIINEAFDEGDRRHIGKTVACDQKK